MSNKGFGLVVLASVLGSSTSLVAVSQNTCNGRRVLSECQRQTIEAMGEIAAAQRALRDFGLYYGDVNGIKNSEFEQGLRDYQRSNQLVPTGRLDQETKAALGIVKVATTSVPEACNPEPNALCTTQKARPAAHEAIREKPNDVVPKRKPNANRVLRQQQPQNAQQLQDVEQRLEQVQQRLEDLQQQLRQQQAPPPAPVNVYVNPPEQLPLIIPTPVVPGLGVPGPYYPNMGVGMGSVVEDIREAQMALRNRGFDPGSFDGMLNAQTQDALLKFQAASGLPLTGAFDDRTQAALGITVRGTSNPDVH